MERLRQTREKRRQRDRRYCETHFEDRSFLKNQNGGKREVLRQRCSKNMYKLLQPDES